MDGLTLSDVLDMSISEINETFTDSNDFAQYLKGIDNYTFANEVIGNYQVESIMTMLKEDISPKYKSGDTVYSFKFNGGNWKKYTIKSVLIETGDSGFHEVSYLLNEIENMSFYEHQILSKEEFVESVSKRRKELEEMESLLNG